MTQNLYGFRAPMLAHKLEDKLPEDAVAEIKYDGHRIIVSKLGDVVRAWSRLETPRTLRPAIVEVLKKFPDGVYDGEEIVPGGTSHNVKELLHAHRTVLILFDVLTHRREDIVVWTYRTRRTVLEECFQEAGIVGGSIDDVVQLSQTVPVGSLDELYALCAELWSEGVEGLIVKDPLARYECGKRRRAFLKLKQEKSATLTVLGFSDSKGEKVDRGECAQIVLVDDDGMCTAVKTPTDVELGRLNGLFPDDPTFERVKIGPRWVDYVNNHPFCGRRYVIDYQDRTSDGSYRHPRADRWESE